ncbi:MAG: hypothetical protein L6R28_21830 [Planctomycetes bacterium]|nr:hypothetical protein [Planctomycetota bacterium]
MVTAPVLPAGPSKKVERSGSRLGRSALFVHGLGVAFALVAAAVLYFAGMDFNTDDPFVLMAVGGGALIACTLWSVVLAVRAVRSRERLLLPAILGLIVWTEASAALLALWFVDYRTLSSLKAMSAVTKCLDYVFWLAQPVLVPAALLSALPSWLLSGWIVRRIEDRRVAKGGLQWNWAQRARMRRGAFAVFLAAFMLLLLPVPLLLFCATTSTYEGPKSLGAYSIPEAEKFARADASKDWRATVGGAMPRVLVDAVEAPFRNGKSSFANRVRMGLIGYGWISAERMAAIAADNTDTYSYPAWLFLQLTEPPVAAQLVRDALAQGASSGQVNLRAKIGHLKLETARLLLDDLYRIADGQAWPSRRVEAFCDYVNAAEEKDAQALIDRWASSPDPKLRESLYTEAGLRIRKSEQCFRILQHGFSEKAPIQLAVVLRYAQFVYRERQDIEKMKILIARGLELLVHEEPPVRVAAAVYLFDLVKLTLLRDDWDELRALEASIAGAAEPPPGKVISKVRAAAEQWLKEHGE